MKKKANSPVKRFIVPLVVLLLGLLSIAVLIFYNNVHKKLHELYLRDDLVHELQIAVLHSHLALEEIAHADTLIRKEDAIHKLELSINTIDAMRYGGQTFHEMSVNALSDDELINTAEEIKLLLSQLKDAVIRQQQSQLEAARDSYFDRIFNAVLEKSAHLLSAFEFSDGIYDKKVSSLFKIILLSWGPVILTAVLGLTIVEVRRKKAEDNLLESQNFVRHIVETTPNMIFIYDINKMSLVYVNEQVRTILGYKPSDFYQRESSLIQNLLHNDDVNKVTNILERLKNAKDREIFEIQCRTRHADGKWRWLLGRITVFERDRDSNLSQILGTAVDITESKKNGEELSKYRERLEDLANERTLELINTNEDLQQEIRERQLTETTLKESKEKYRLLSRQFKDLLEAIHDPIVLISAQRRITWANSAALAEYDSSGKPDMKGLHCYELGDSVTGSCEDCPISRAFASGKPESANISTNAGRIWDLRVFPVKDEEGVVQNAITIRSDVTEKMRLQSETVRSGHLASLGELAAGVAHEINNPINGIINFAQLLSDVTEAGSRENDYAHEIINEGERVANIVGSLLSFARYDNDGKCPASIQDILFESISLTRANIEKDGINLEIDVPSTLPEIVAHFQQIQQVFLNVINNARYALNQKYPKPVKEKMIRISGGTVITDNRHYVRVYFHDTGSGIQKNIIHKIINPFFSTKPKDEGTGLGLSISHGIITNHGGNFRIDSIEGKYTRVEIELPCVDRE